MQIDTQLDRTMFAALRRQGARGPWLHLLAQVLRLAGERVELLRHAERPWASVTFSGTRHAIALRFRGAQALEEGEAFIAALPDHEFAIPRQLVADATIAAVDHVAGESPVLTVEAELLLLEDF